MPARPSVDLDFETEAVPVPAPLFGARGGFRSDGDGEDHGRLWVKQ